MLQRSATRRQMSSLDAARARRMHVRVHRPVNMQRRNQGDGASLELPASVRIRIYFGGLAVLYRLFR